MGTYDLIVVGGGPAGYVGALYASARGKKVALVERDTLGGVCLNRGCIPTKAFIETAKLYTFVRENAAAQGIRVEGVHVDVAQMLARKEEIVGRLVKGIAFLLKRGKVDVYEGTGRLLPWSTEGANRVEVLPREGGEGRILNAQHVLLATGSLPRYFPGMEPDGRVVLSSDDALRFERVPKAVAIVGGGAIGVEWAYIYHSLGAKVYLLEALDRILPLEDEEVSREVTRIFKKRGIELYTGTALREGDIERRDTSAVVHVQRPQGALALEVDFVLVAVGRIPNTEGLGLEGTSVRRERGFVVTKENLETDQPGVYAAGDVAGAPLLAHKASHEAILAVRSMLGEEVRKPDPRDIPRATFGSPEVASVGYTEAEAREAGFAVRTAKFPVRANGRALIEGEVDGFVKLVADEATGEILGVHIVGPRAGDLIGEGSLLRYFRAKDFALAETVHPHPTLVEMLGEAGLQLLGTPIHA
ncbi:MAG: dihydrolipoyl dehydrogenase [Brockia lithotrophica]|nr:dihydrolipoyl dehydrogenase [Brockia lithotrophica]